ncbi:hypothetical protein H4Q26_014974 [Puccinia striiformis f. sp. tritici PST-130]|nr:hypothetical protein H4Q26_014974 [Puccinia striiformis f. sp. tritici PST-130]
MNHPAKRYLQAANMFSGEVRCGKAIASVSNRIKLLADKAPYEKTGAVEMGGSVRICTLLRKRRDQDGAGPVTDGPPFTCKENAVAVDTTPSVKHPQPSGHRYAIMASAAEDPERWASDGTGALSLRLARSKAAVDQLGPLEQDLIAKTIYGYEDLDVQLVFNSSTLKNYLSINYTASLPEPDPIEKIIYKYIPSDYTKSEENFQTDLEASGTSKFTPPGKKISSYRSLPSKGKRKSEHFLASKRWERCTTDQMEDEQDVIYELWATNWKTPGFRDYHRRMQILVLFYIEGGTYIEEDDDRWSLSSCKSVNWAYRLAAINRLTPIFTRRSLLQNNKILSFLRLCFTLFVLPLPIFDSTPTIPFIVLPPYQSTGHGSMLYSQIFHYLLARPEVAELTLEDPSESFEDLRDKEDLKLLLKIKGQFARLLELALRWKFTALKESDDGKLERLYRIAVKERLYRFNYDSLVDLSKEERREKLQDTFQNVMDDYDRILRGERREIS